MSSRSDVVSLEPEDVLNTHNLYRRRARPAPLQAELKAYHDLSTLMATDPVKAIQRFLEIALELCPAAGSAGLSELAEEDGEPIFRWTAMAGAFAPYVGGTTPRDFSPCGLCLDNHHTVLVDRPARIFTYFNNASPPITEGLIVPLYDTGKRPIGTLWVTSHTGAKFDPTDARLIEQLAVQLVLAIKLRRKARIVVQLEETVRDREILVQEVRHRVKNMIQMTSALLHLQQRELKVAEARTALGEAQNRL
jgi:two-component sensor histidine kinase